MHPAGKSAADKNAFGATIAMSVIMSLDKKNSTACIVDAYSTGFELSQKLKELGWRVINVQSGPVVPKAFSKSFDPTLFDIHLPLAALGYPNLVERLKSLNPIFVIAGSEPGVELADHLSTSLHLEGNSPTTSLLRRNKYYMSQTLADHNLNSVEQYLVNTPDELRMASKTLGRWPIVVKPIDAMGSENVRVCFDDQEALSAFIAIDGHENFIGSINSGALIQEYLEGEQYVVNAVSLGGHHRITEMWHETRLNIRDVGNIYDYETMIPYQGKRQSLLIDYTRDVLSALGINEGPSHSEIMLTKRGPVLIETGARMQGGIVSAPIIEAIDDSHMTMTLKRYLDPQGFAKKINASYRMRSTPRVVNLIMNRAGIVRQNNCERLLGSLPSFRMIVRTPAVGDYVAKTIDLASKVGHVYLMHSSIEQLDRDYKQIRDWENTHELIVLE
ncbi:ATP-grasp domain-containing protein [Pseudomonas putida]